MNKTVITFALMAAATSAFAGGKFSASDVPGVGIHKSGRIVIANTRTSITAYRFFGNIREALVTLRATPPAGLSYSSYTDTLFDSNAVLNAPIPQHLADAISDAARAHGVDPRLIAAVARRESA